MILKIDAVQNLSHDREIFLLSQLRQSAHVSCYRKSWNELIKGRSKATSCMPTRDQNVKYHERSVEAGEEIDIDRELI